MIRLFSKSKQAANNSPPENLPVKPGRVSIPEWDRNSLITAVSRVFSLPGIVSKEDIKLLWSLDATNPDFAQAVGNHVNLACTNYAVEVLSGASEKRVLDEITLLKQRLQKNLGGFNGLVRQMFRQLFVTGAVSTEAWVFEKTLEGLFDIVLVPVSSIEFITIDGIPYPAQRQAKSLEPVLLNPKTYCYLALKTREDIPYAIPPYLSVILPVAIQVYGVENTEFIFRKFGLLGLVDLTVTRPPREAGEDEETYRQRVQGYINDVAKSAGDEYRNGMMVHGDDIKLEHHSVVGDAKGAGDIWKQNEELIASGLDTTPSMLGRSHSTTETHFTVAYELETEKIVSAQLLVAAALKQHFELHCLLKGIPAELKVKFEKPKGIRGLQKAQEESKRIDNVTKKVNQGFIDRDEGARELGYEKATGTVAQAGGQNQSGQFALSASSGVKLSVERAYKRFLDTYLTRVRPYVKKAESAGLDALFLLWEDDLFSPQNEEDFAQRSLNVFVESAGLSVSENEEMHLAAKKETRKWWHYFRTETGIWDEVDLNDPEKVKAAKALQQIDARAQEFLEDVEQLYWGRAKFFKNSTYGAQLQNFLKDQYLELGISHRPSKKQLKSLEKAFPEMIDTLGAKKTKQIVTTSLTRIQNIAQTRQMFELDIAQFTIAGPNDSKTCGYCKGMIGRVFEVATEHQRIERIIEAGAESEEHLNPFLTNIGYSEGEIQSPELSSSEIQSQGGALPPYHPECRHRTRAILDGSV